MILGRRAARAGDQVVITDAAVRSGPCSCGFVRTGVVPERLCADCGDRLLTGWVREERRLLDQHPAYRDAVARALSEAAAAQQRALVSRMVDEPMVLAELERDNAGKKLSRIRKTHEKELLLGSTSAWMLLARGLQHDPRLARARSLRAFEKAGLGAAQLTRLAWLAPRRAGRSGRTR